MPTTQWDNQTKLLFAVYSLFALANACSGTYVNIYLWKIKPDYALIGWFALVQQLSLGAVFLLGGKWVKEKNKMIWLRAGMVLSGAFYTLVLVLGEYSIHCVELLGIVLGSSLGCFWLAYNVIYFEVTNAYTRDSYNGGAGIVASSCTMIAPWLSGLVITAYGPTGYKMMFSVSLFIFACGILLSFKLSKRPPGASFDWTVPLHAWRDKNSPWRAAFFAMMAQGLRDGVYMFLIGLLVYIATSNELKLGTYTMLTSFASLVVFYVVGKWLSGVWRAKTMLIGTICMGAAVVPLLFGVNYISLLLYGLIMSSFSPLFIVPMTSSIFDLMGRDDEAASNRVELTVLRECGLCLGRILSITMFIGVVWWSEQSWMIILYLAIIGCMPLISSLLMRPFITTKL
ncbi:MFS transporter [Paenibacillus agilis]|uniref:MFS transporter n=1 Tax=Paenibacillus agilis TaxID=3020863 RepID=A0A559IX02_9BACL|nr:MFS transporter [Paenibacillus agilis]TVX92121.1 MFS transporter [Paenibacillus agilis]